LKKTFENAHACRVRHRCVNLELPNPCIRQLIEDRPTCLLIYLASCGDHGDYITT